MAFPLARGETAWFALTVKPRHEKSVAANLSRKGLETYVPLYDAVRRWSDRRKVVAASLFPGYVFCRYGYENQLDVLNLPGVKSVVSFGDMPARVSDAEIEAVRAVLQSGRPASPWPFLRAGNRVRFLSGSMAGVEGILVRQKESLRVVVSIELLRRSVAVEIDRDMIEPLD